MLPDLIVSTAKNMKRKAALMGGARVAKSQARKILCHILREARVRPNA
jgi:hypothetical protein